MNKANIKYINTKNFTALLLSLLFSAAAMVLHAQVEQPYRYEITRKNSDDYYTIIPMKEAGIALLRHQDKYKGSKRRSLSAVGP